MFAIAVGLVAAVGAPERVWTGKDAEASPLLVATRLRRDVYDTGASRPTRRLRPIYTSEFGTTSPEVEACEDQWCNLIPLRSSS